MESEDVQTYRCHLCHRRYKRSEHLKRHYASHSSERPHACNFCHRGFQRSDALKRHLRICSNHDEETASTRVQKRRACDGCVRMKKACNSGYPCQTCRDKGINCTYFLVESANDRANNTIAHSSSNLLNDFNGSSESDVDGFLQTSFWAELNDPDNFDFSRVTWTDFLNLPSSTSDVVRTDSDQQPSLQFLDNFTKMTGFTRSFDCGTLEQQQAVLEHAKHLYEPSSTIIEPTNLERGHSSDSLAPKSLEIVDSIKNVTMTMPKNSPIHITWSNLVEEICSQFFAPHNLRKYLELYWSIWHPNVNIVHRPTFNAISSKATLVAAMVIIGACVSPESADRENALRWFNCVEEIVFVDDDFCDDNLDVTEEPPSRSKIESLQAAYMVCLYQNWEGDDKSRRRIRRHRFSTLVAVARDIGIRKAKHPDYTCQSRDSFDWSQFVATEELIRVFLWTFLLDTAFVIFNNLPPRMMIREMTLDMANCEAIFQASTAQTCWTLLYEYHKTEDPKATSARITLYAATKTMCHEEVNDEFCNAMASLGPLNLFVVTSAFHSLIFQFQNSFGMQAQLVSIRNALENWKAAWTLYMGQYSRSPAHMPLGSQELDSTNMWRRIGFMRHAAEYWLLASLILDRLTAFELRHSVDGSMKDEKDETQPSHKDDQQPMLQKYDETSMRQVNELIADFQRATIG